MEQFQSLVSIAPWGMITALANLLLLTLALKKFLFAPVQAILEKRQQAADALLSEADEAKQQAILLQQQYEEGLANAKQEAATLLEQADKTATLRSEQTLQEARAAAAELKRKAQQEIAQQRSKALNEVKNQLGGMALEIATKVVQREISPQDHTAFIDDFIQNVGDAS